MISAARVAELSGGLLSEAAPVRVNRAVVEHDVVLLVGPVFWLGGSPGQIEPGLIRFFSPPGGLQEVRPTALNTPTTACSWARRSRMSRATAA